LTPRVLFLEQEARWMELGFSQCQIGRMRNDMSEQTTLSRPVSRVSEAVRSCCNEQGGILLDIQRGQMFRINAVGSKILNFVERGYDERQIAEEICRAYGVEIETAESDVHEFFEALYEHRLLKSSRSAECAKGFDS
jgi:hypothetical protein